MLSGHFMVFLKACLQPRMRWWESIASLSMTCSIFGSFQDAIVVVLLDSLCCLLTKIDQYGVF